MPRIKAKGWAQTRERPRCTECGEHYYRRDRVEIWYVRNPGHRIGWEKVIQSLCLSCSTTKRAQQILFLAGWSEPATKAEGNGRNHGKR